MRTQARLRPILSLFLVAVAALACAPLPPVTAPEFQRTRSFDLDPPEAWLRILEVMARKGIQLKAVERESGMIYGEELIPRDPRLADCGSGRSWSAFDTTALTLNIFVRRNGGGTKITVNTKYKQMYSSGLDARFVLCHSTGALEEEIFAALR